MNFDKTLLILCEKNLIYHRKNLFQSLAALVAFVAGLTFGRFVVHIGKKHALMLSSVFYFLGLRS